VSEFEEIYPRNGYFHMHMKYATSGASVTVNCPDDLGLYVQFASREGAKFNAPETVCMFAHLRSYLISEWPFASGIRRSPQNGSVSP
jgi:hypothetical protein